MQSKEENNVIFIRLFPGEDIYSELEHACQKHKVETAVVLSGVGQLKQFELGYFKEKGDYTPEGFEKPHELLSLTGSISNQGGEYNFHLHAVLGNEEKSVVGGHLIKGIVEVTNEIIVLKTSLKFKRKLEQSTGLQGMYLAGGRMEISQWKTNLKRARASKDSFFAQHWQSPIPPKDATSGKET